MSLRSNSGGPVLRFDLAAAARGWLPPQVSEAFCTELSGVLQVSVREAGAPSGWAGAEGVQTCTWPGALAAGPIHVVAAQQIMGAVAQALGLVARKLGLSTTEPALKPADGTPSNTASSSLQTSRFVIGTSGRRLLLGATEPTVLAWWNAVEVGQPTENMRAHVETLTLPAQVALGRRRMSLNAVSEMVVGDVLLLGPSNRGVALEVAGTPRFLAVPVHKNGVVGARVTERLAP
jgi:hypothetical protein